MILILDIHQNFGWKQKCSTVMHLWGKPAVFLIRHKHLLDPQMTPLGGQITKEMRSHANIGCR